MLFWVRRILLAAAAGALTVILIGPWVLYAVALSNVVGRPSLTDASALSSADAEAVWQGPPHDWWHLSGAALTVWLTRNWSTEQLVAKAREIRRSNRPASNHGVNSDPLPAAFAPVANGPLTPTVSRNCGSSG